MELLRHRIKAERKRLRLTQGQLAALVDKSMGQSFISNLETGEREETPFIAELAHVLGVDAYWLKTGKGKRTGSVELSSDEQAIIDAFRLFGVEMKEAWLNAAKARLAKEAESKEKAA